MTSLSGHKKRFDHDDRANRGRDALAAAGRARHLTAGITDIGETRPVSLAAMTTHALDTVLDVRLAGSVAHHPRRKLEVNQSEPTGRSQRCEATGREEDIEEERRLL